MALGDNYATLAQLKDYLGIGTQTSLDEKLNDALSSASREVELFCNRQFNKDTVVSARVYQPNSCKAVDVDDFHTTTGLIVKTDNACTGTFDTTWAASDYELSPYSGVVDGQPGHPFDRITAVGGRYFPQVWQRRRGIVEVTAQWGWAAVPAPVKQATLILAAQTFKLADAPFGVAGMSEFGVVRVRDMPQVQAKLARYVRYTVLVG